MMNEIRKDTGTTVSKTEIENYTSKKDILYLLHSCANLFKRVGTEKPVITTRQLHLLIIFYLHKNGLVTEAVRAWMESNYGRFVSIMRNGP